MLLAGSVGEIDPYLIKNSEKVKTVTLLFEHFKKFGFKAAISN
jgi:hypothetical protein